MPGVIFAVAVELGAEVGLAGEAKANQWIRERLKDYPSVEAIHRDAMFLCGFVEFQQTAADSQIEGFLVAVCDREVTDENAPSWLVDSLMLVPAEDGIKFCRISRAIATTQ